MISIRCNCGETYHADEQHVGRHIQCRCGKVLEVVEALQSVKLAGDRETSRTSASNAWERTRDIYSRFRVGANRGTWIAASIAGLVLLCWGGYMLGKTPKDAYREEEVKRDSTSCCNGNVACGDVWNCV